MSQPSHPPVTHTFTEPRWFTSYWNGVKANRYQPVAIAVIVMFAAMVLVGPWFWGLANIIADIVGR